MPDRSSRGKLLFAFLFALRKSECLKIGSDITVTFAPGGVYMDLSGAVLKSNRTQGCRLGCLCKTEYSDYCLHKYQDVIESITKGFDLPKLCKAAKMQGTSHSLRIGAAITLYYASAASVDVIMHFRWSDSIMFVYYIRNSNLFPEEEVRFNFLRADLLAKK